MAADLILILAFMAFAVQQLESKRARRAAKWVRSPIHLRFSRAFAFAAFLPTAIMSVAATAVVGLFLGNWLVSDVHGSLVTATTAVRSHVDAAVAELLRDAPKFATAFENRLFLDPSQIDRPRRVLNDLQNKTTFNWKYAFAIDGDCNIVGRGDRSYKFRFDPPPSDIMMRLGARPTESSSCLAPSVGMPTGGEPRPALTGRGWLDRNGVLVGAVYPYDDSELAALMKLNLWSELYLLVVTKGNSKELLQLSASLEGPTGDFSSNSIRQLGKFILVATLSFLPVALVAITGVILLGRRFSSRLAPPFTNWRKPSRKSARANWNRSIPGLLQGQDEIAAFARGFDHMIIQLGNNTEMVRSRG